MSWSSSDPESANSAQGASAGSAVPTGGFASTLEETRVQLMQFTSAASVLAKDLDAGLGNAVPRIGPMLDQARAWAAYLADGGLLARQIPLGTPMDQALAYLTQIAEFRRAAEQWVLYFDEQSRGSLSSASDAAREEQSYMAQVEHAEQRVNAQTFALTLNTSNMNYWQMNDAIRGLNQLLSELFAMRPTANRLLAAGRPACSQRLEALIINLQGKIQLFQGSAAGKGGFESAMGLPPSPIRPYWLP
jgi:hypothetical protein